MIARVYSFWKHHAGLTCFGNPLRNTEERLVQGFMLMSQMPSFVRMAALSRCQRTGDSAAASSETKALAPVDARASAMS